MPALQGARRKHLNLGGLIRMTSVRNICRSYKFPRSLRLKTILVLIALVGVLLARDANHRYRQQQAIELLSDWNLAVLGELDFDHLPGSLLPEQCHPWFNPLRISVIPKYCRVPFYEGVVIEGATVNRSDPNPVGWRFEETKIPHEPGPTKRKQIMAAMATLRDLKSIRFPYVLDEEDLKILSTLTQLEYMAFKTDGMTHSGVAHILNLRNLVILYIYFDTADCMHIQSMTKLYEHSNLQILQLVGPSFPSDGLARLKAALPHVDVEFVPDEIARARY
jgi:hypothetical protein